MMLILVLLWDVIIAFKGRNYNAKMCSCLREKQPLLRSLVCQLIPFAST
jgi:hypothetical protein